MNAKRIVVLMLAAVAAGSAALLVRGMLGGGAEKASANVAPPPVAMTDVLVAAHDIAPGQPVTAEMVHWQEWPKANVSSDLITGDSKSSAAAAVEGSVARSPIVKNEPITGVKIVKSGATGFMAATLTPGMRAAAITVSIATLAGGFIQPGDRVDIILTVKNDANNTKADVVLSDVRVLAVDQTAKAKDDNKAVEDAKTVTLELAPDQATDLARAQAMGTLSLALRPLGESGARQTAATGRDASGPIVIIRGSAGPQASGRN
jgi:pilus assembly protein CpaB